MTHKPDLEATTELDSGTHGGGTKRTPHIALLLHYKVGKESCVRSTRIAARSNRCSVITHFYDLYRS